MKYFLQLLCLAFVIPLHAQDFQGEATYVTKRNFSVNLDEAQMSEQQKKMIRERMKQFSESTHKLTFNRTSSIYQSEASLSPQTPGGRGGMRFRMMGAGGSGKLHVDIARQQYTRQVELMGKFFLIQDSIERPKWQMTQETKKIGNYNCFKATYTQTVRRPMFRPGQRARRGEAPPMEEEEVEVVAWYTPQIPVSMGPEQWTGLPGLILELSDGNATTLCTQVVMNPKEKKAIEAPKKGKVVNQKDFEEIQQKQMEEMRERFRNNSGRAQGQRIFISG